MKDKRFICINTFKHKYICGMANTIIHVEFSSVSTIAPMYLRMFLKIVDLERSFANSKGIWLIQCNNSFAESSG